MPVRKPTLGYPSLTDAVVALRAEGLDRNQIARRCAVPVKSVYAVERDAARRVGGPFRVSAATAAALRPHALARATTVEVLARRIVETVVRDGIVDAVLDDGGDVGR